MGRQRQRAVAHGIDDPAAVERLQLGVGLAVDVQRDGQQPGLALDQWHEGAVVRSRAAQVPVGFWAWCVLGIEPLRRRGTAVQYLAVEAAKTGALPRGFTPDEEVGSLALGSQPCTPCARPPPCGGVSARWSWEREAPSALLPSSAPASGARRSMRSPVRQA